MPFSAPDAEVLDAKPAGFSAPDDEVVSKGFRAPDSEVVDMSHIQGSPVNQPSQFASGQFSGLIDPESEDWQLTKATGGGPLMKVPEVAGNVVRAIPADVAAEVGGTPEFSGNIKAAVTGQPLPVDTALSLASQESPGYATMGKVSQGLAQTAPLLALGAGAPEWAQKLMALGFSGQMIASAPEQARALGEELGKPPAQRDQDKITSAISDLSQDVAFAPLAAAHGLGSYVGERFFPKREAIDRLAQQLKTNPFKNYAPAPLLAFSNDQKQQFSAPQDEVVTPPTPAADTSPTALADLQNAIRGNQLAPQEAANAPEIRQAAQQAVEEAPPVDVSQVEVRTPDGKLDHIGTAIARMKLEQQQSTEPTPQNPPEVQPSGTGAETTAPAAPAALPTKADIQQLPDDALKAGYQQYNDEAKQALANKEFDRVSQLATVAQWHREELERRSNAEEPLTNSGGNAEEPTPISQPEVEATKNVPAVETPAAQPGQSQPTKIVHEDKPGLYGSKYMWAVVDGHPWKIRISDHDAGQSSAPPMPEVARARREQLAEAATIPNENAFNVSWLTDDPSQVTFQDVVNAIRNNVADEFYTHEDAKFGGTLWLKGDAKTPEAEVEGDYQKEPVEQPKNPLSNLADKLESLKTNVSKSGQLHAFGLAADLWDKAITVAQGVLRAGGKVGDAIEAAINHIKANYKGKFDEAGARDALQMRLEPQHGISQKMLERRANAGQISEIKPGVGINPEQAINNGRELLEKGYDVNGGLDEFERTGKYSVDLVQAARAMGEKMTRELVGIERSKGIDSPEYKEAKARLDSFEQRIKPLATESHKSMVSYQGAVDIDTGSITGLTRAVKEETGKEPTPQQIESAKRISEQNKAAQDAEKSAKEKLFSEIDKMPGTPEKPKISEYILKAAENIVARLDKRAEAARQRIRERSGRLMAGIDPQMLLDYAEIGASHIAHIGLDFAKWSAEMVKEFGDDIKPHLDEIFLRSQDIADEEIANEKPTQRRTVEKQVKKSTEKSEAAAAEVAWRVARKNATKLAETENKQRVSKTKTPKVLSPQEKAAKDALDAAARRVKQAAEQAVENDISASLKSSGKPDIDEIQNKAEKQAIDAAIKRAKQAAANAVQKDLDAQVSKTKGVDVQAKQAAKIAEMAIKRAKKAAEDAVRSAINNRLLRANKHKLVMQHIRENYLKRGATDLGDIVNGTAVDLGMSVNEVRQAMASNPTVKRMTDEVYRRSLRMRQLKQQAQDWVKSQGRPSWLNIASKVPTAFFNAATLGHGTVGFITHAGNQMFQPRFADLYWRNFARQYRMAFGNPIYHAKMMEDLQHRPLFDFALHNGLVIDPHSRIDDYQTAPLTKWFGGIGNRGFDTLKLYRMDVFEREWSKMPSTLRTAESAKLLAAEINQSTGVIKSKFNGFLSKAASAIMFAPKLELSRWQFLFGNPVKAILKGADWKNATPEERQMVIREFKNKAFFLGTYYAALMANQGLLSASGSNQKINVTDPHKPDWLAFKGFGHEARVISPMISMIKFIGREIHDLAGKRTQKEQLFKGTRGDEALTDLGGYARGKLSPFAQFMADIGTRHDFEGNTIPFSSEKPFRGRHVLSVGEFASENLVPIPIEEAAKEVWTQQGMLSTQADDYWKAIITAAISGGTGARISEDKTIAPR